MPAVGLVVGVGIDTRLPDVEVVREVPDVVDEGVAVSLLDRPVGEVEAPNPADIVPDPVWTRQHEGLPEALHPGLGEGEAEGGLRRRCRPVEGHGEPRLSRKALPVRDRR